MLLAAVANIGSAAFDGDNTSSPLPRTKPELGEALPLVQPRPQNAEVGLGSQESAEAEAAIECSKNGSPNCTALRPRIAEILAEAGEKLPGATSSIPLEPAELGKNEEWWRLKKDYNLLHFYCTTSQVLYYQWSG